MGVLTVAKPGGKPQPQTAEKKIIIQNLFKQFKTKKGIMTAVKDVSLTVNEGEFVTIVGPSGCGKTTTIRVLAELEKPTSGRIEIMHRDPSKPLNTMIFQGESVLPWLTVSKNMAFGLDVRGISKEIQAQRVEEYLRITGLEAFAHAYPSQLSGGMKQRVSVARAFINDPEILLMDEPFVGLDEQNRLLLQIELLKIWDAHRKTVLFITHSIDEALLLSDRVLIMTASPGQIREEFIIPFKRPRDIEELRNSPEFNELFTTIWAKVKEEVSIARARM